MRMIIRKAFDTSTWCIRCRFHFLRFGAHLRPPFDSTVKIHHLRDALRGVQTSRSFTSLRSWRLNVLDHEPPRTSILEEDDVENEKSTADENEDAEPQSSTPWYLQVDTPQRALNALLERQRLPDLPPEPPPLLQPMLEYISVELGLDDLMIFDLRKVDPPPALGANVLMVIGTARSEKHLHVSADRFCRWLKVTHKLSPYADGLLGRGELRLKLRRKARRAKRLSKVGSSEVGNADDGIRTGWICVNVGSIESGTDSLENYGVQEGYVGFGSEAGGARVVIQMLTQEKREDLDLEDLWGKMVKRHERKQDRIVQGQNEYLSDQEVNQSSRP